MELYFTESQFKNCLILEHYLDIYYLILGYLDFDLQNNNNIEKLLDILVSRNKIYLANLKSYTENKYISEPTNIIKQNLGYLKRIKEEVNVNNGDHIICSLYKSFQKSCKEMEELFN